MDTKLSENWNWRNFQKKRRKKKTLELWTNTETFPRVVDVKQLC